MIIYYKNGTKTVEVHTMTVAELNTTLVNKLLKSTVSETIDGNNYNDFIPNKKVWTGK